MTIGIGITTTPNRRDYYERCLINVHHFSQHGVEVFSYCDEKKKGIAYAKNVCIDHLKGNDYVFLFDDDCFPYKVGWENYFIDCLGENNHLLYLAPHHRPKQWSKNYKCVTYKECGGVMIMVTKKAIERVGYMDSAYMLHGFEHAGYSQRIFNAGLNESPYICPTNASEYIYSLDYMEDTVKSSLTEFEKKKYYAFNQALFMRECKSDAYKPFKK